MTSSEEIEINRDNEWQRFAEKKIKKDNRIINRIRLSFRKFFIRKQKDKVPKIKRFVSIKQQRGLRHGS